MEPMTRTLLLVVFIVSAAAWPSPAMAQIKAQVRSAPTPPWTKGILPINRESYYNAIECGKQGGQDPPCVFWDTGLCKNDDFVLSFYTPYKMVAHAVWTAVRQRQPPPTPDYAAAQRTRVTVGVKPAPGSRNALADLVLTREGRTVPHASRMLVEGDARFTFDYPVWVATTDVTLQLVGKTKTVSCVIDQATLSQMR